MKRQVLIIGGTRFVGPELIKKLIKNHDNVTVFSRGTNYHKTINEQVKRIYGNRDVDSDLKQLKGKKYDIVYDMCNYNLNQVEKVLPYLQTQHYVFFSTASVYKKPIMFPIKESDLTGEWDSFGEYGINKRQVEKRLEHDSKKGEFKLSIIRPVYILGKDNYFDRENYYFSRILNNQLILVPGRGQALIQFCFLEDVAEALFRIPIMQNKQIEIVNLGGDQNISVLGFVELCGKIVGQTPRIIKLNTKKFDLDEEHFYDNLYPFPNVSLILDNTKAKKVYRIIFTQLDKGLEIIYQKWKCTWKGETNKSDQEKTIIETIGHNFNKWTI